MVERFFWTVLAAFDRKPGASKYPVVPQPGGLRELGASCEYGFRPVDLQGRHPITSERGLLIGRPQAWEDCAPKHRRRLGPDLDSSRVHPECQLSKLNVVGLSVIARSLYPRHGTEVTTLALDAAFSVRGVRANVVNSRHRPSLAVRFRQSSDPECRPM